MYLVSVNPKQTRTKTQQSIIFLSYLYFKAENLPQQFGFDSSPGPLAACHPPSLSTQPFLYLFSCHCVQKNRHAKKKTSLKKTPEAYPCWTLILEKELLDEHHAIVRVNAATDLGKLHFGIPFITLPTHQSSPFPICSSGMVRTGWLG